MQSTSVETHPKQGTMSFAHVFLSHHSHKDDSKAQLWVFKLTLQENMAEILRSFMSSMLSFKIKAEPETYNVTKHVISTKFYEKVKSRLFSQSTYDVDTPAFGVDTTVITHFLSPDLPEACGTKSRSMSLFTYQTKLSVRHKDKYH